MRHNFVATGSPLLRSARVSSCRASVCYLLSSGGITRLLWYYEVIRLPMPDSSACLLSVVGTLFHPWKRTWGLPGCRTVSMSYMPWSKTPGKLLRTARGALMAPVLPFHIDFRHARKRRPSRLQFRGSIPSTFRLTACMLALLRLSSGSPRFTPRARYPAGAALPGRGSHPRDCTTLPGRTVRGRDAGCPAPPARIRTRSATPYGSYLGSSDGQPFVWVRV